MLGGRGSSGAPAYTPKFEQVGGWIRRAPRGTASVYSGTRGVNRADVVERRHQLRPITGARLLGTRDSVLHSTLECLLPVA